MSFLFVLRTGTKFGEIAFSSPSAPTLRRNLLGEPPLTADNREALSVILEGVYLRAAIFFQPFSATKLKHSQVQKKNFKKHFFLRLISVYTYNDDKQSVDRVHNNFYILNCAFLYCTIYHLRQLQPFFNTNLVKRPDKLDSAMN